MSYIQRHDTAGSTQPINPYDQRGTSPTQGYTEPRYNQTQPAPVQAMTSDIPVDEIAKLFKRKDPSELQMDANGQRGWSENIFDCFNDLGTFCMAYWCPCIVYGQVKQRINYLEHTGRPDPDRGGNGIGNDCLYHGALNMCCGLGSLLQMGSRRAIRSRYRIRGEVLEDGLLACFCTPCDLTQESRELQHEERKHQA